MEGGPLSALGDRLVTATVKWKIAGSWVARVFQEAGEGPACSLIPLAQPSWVPGWDVDGNSDSWDSPL